MGPLLINMILAENFLLTFLLKNGIFFLLIVIETTCNKKIDHKSGQVELSE